MLDEFLYNVVFLLLYNAVYILFLSWHIAYPLVIWPVFDVKNVCENVNPCFQNFTSMPCLQILRHDIYLIYDLWLWLWFTSIPRHVPTSQWFVSHYHESTTKYRCYIFLWGTCYSTKYIDFRKVHAASLPPNTLFYTTCITNNITGKTRSTNFGWYDVRTKFHE
jgi:hypothetical protein